MYYYAMIDPSTYVCYDITESETQVTDNEYWIQIDSYDTSYKIRKKYVNGEWVDTTAAEAQQFEGKYIGIFGEWLDVVLNGKASTSHTHAVGDISDVATVSEVETYLGI